VHRILVGGIVNHFHTDGGVVIKENWDAFFPLSNRVENYFK